MNELQKIRITGSALSFIFFVVVSVIANILNAFVRRSTVYGHGAMHHGAMHLALRALMWSAILAALLVTTVSAQPYDKDVRNQLPDGVSALRSIPNYDKSPRGALRGQGFPRSNSTNEMNNLSGTTRRFLDQPKDSALYSAIIEKTPWKSEWRTEKGETCLQSAAKAFNLDPVLILAIIEQESSFDPKAENHNDNESVDIGLMQINSQWNEFLAGVGIQQKHLFDPCMNTHIGAWILHLSINDVGDVWRGVGVYNAGTSVTPNAEKRRQTYTDAVSKRFNALNRKLGRDRWDLAALDF